MSLGAIPDFGTRSVTQNITQASASCRSAGSGAFFFQSNILSFILSKVCYADSPAQKVPECTLHYASGHYSRLHSIILKQNVEESARTKTFISTLLGCTQPRYLALSILMQRRVRSFFNTAFNFQNAFKMWRFKPKK